MLSPDTLHHQEEVNSALDRQIRQDIQDMAQEAQIQAQIIAHEGKFLFCCYFCPCYVYFCKKMTFLQVVALTDGNVRHLLAAIIFFPTNYTSNYVI